MQKLSKKFFVPKTLSYSIKSFRNTWSHHGLSNIKCNFCWKDVCERLSTILFKRSYALIPVKAHIYQNNYYSIKQKLLHITTSQLKLFLTIRLLYKCLFMFSPKGYNALHKTTATSTMHSSNVSTFNTTYIILHFNDIEPWRFCAYNV